MSTENAPILFSALARHDTAELRRSEDAGEDWNTTDARGQNAMHWVLRLGHADWLGLLIRQGVHSNHQDDKGDTPLHYAVRHRRGVFCVHQLLAAGAAAGALNHDGVAPIYEALCQGNQEMFQALAVRVSEDTPIGPQRMTLRQAVQRQRPEWLPDVPKAESPGLR